VGSPATSNNKISDDLKQLLVTNTQSSDVTTITLSSPDTLIEIDSEEFPNTTKTEEKQCQTTGGVYLSHDEYESLLKKASFCPNFQNDLLKIRSAVSNLVQPEADWWIPTHLRRYAKMLMVKTSTYA
jgi:hypothetical protein